MAFKVSTISRPASNGFTLVQTHKATLNGLHGPLAKTILALPTNHSGTWTLHASSLAKELFPGATTETLLLWFPSEPGALPQLVTHICGISHETESEILVHMELLFLETDGSLHPTGCHLSEALRLLGGRSTPAASFQWAKPKMSIGSAILGPPLRPSLEASQQLP